MEVLLHNRSGSKPHSCCSSHGSWLWLWHGNNRRNKIIRYIFLWWCRFHAYLSSHLNCSLFAAVSELQLLCDVCYFLRNILRSILAELFLVGVCLYGWRVSRVESRMMQGYDETAWVELAAHVRPGRMERANEGWETCDKAWERSGWGNGSVQSFQRLSNELSRSAYMIPPLTCSPETRWNFQLCITAKVSVKRKKTSCSWSTPRHMLLIEKTVYILSHFAQIFPSDRKSVV